MSGKAVVNASPLIYTARADLFHLLRFAAREIVVPQEVASEILARALGIPLRGTLGIVLRARREKAIPKARPILEKLRAAGMYLSDKTLEAVLAEVGE